MKPPTVSGVVSFQSPLSVATGASCGFFFTRKCRMFGKFAAAFSSTKLFELETTISMFDWPLQIQTSPTRTSWTVTEFRPATVRKIVEPVVADRGK